MTLLIQHVKVLTFTLKRIIMDKNAEGKEAVAWKRKISIGQI